MSNSGSETSVTSVAVVGAGILGLATSWFLQERGVTVTVFEADRIGTGASWGNAGWLSPALSTPLPEASVLRYGLRSIFSSSSPVHVPARFDPRLFRFLGHFVRNCTTARWERAFGSLMPLNDAALVAYDKLLEGGMDGGMVEADSFVAAFRTERDRDEVLRKIAHLRRMGQDVEFDVLTGTEARELEPCLSDAVGAGINLLGQRYVDPGEYVQRLARAVLDRGGRILEGAKVSDIESRRDRVSISLDGGLYDADFECAVIATGAYLGVLARSVSDGTVPVQSGRGYSFSVPVDLQPSGPIYFPTQRVACTPWRGRLRVTGMMEFSGVDEPLQPRRLDTVARAAAPLLRGIRMGEREDEWVGARPCTWDGLPLVGPTRLPRVFVATGHGMFGMTLGPVTGLLLAEEIATGRRCQELAPFSPLR